MPRERVCLLVEVDLDPMPGVMHTAESARDWVLIDLMYVMPHYNPTVEIKNNEKEND